MDDKRVATIEGADISERTGVRDAATGSVWAGWRAQRKELLVVISLMVIVVISAVVAMSHLAAASPADACWRIESGFTPGRQSNDCRAQFGVFWDFKHREAQSVIGLASFLPFAVGLLLSVPIVARASHRPGWGNPRRLPARQVLPMLLVVIGGLSIVAILISIMGRAAEPSTSLGPGRVPSLDDLTVAPVSFVARGVMAFGVGLLAGALLRKALPAYGAASLILLVVIGAGAWGVHGVVADRVAVWEVLCADGMDDCEDPDGLYYLESGFRDGDGEVLTPGQAHDVMLERCATCRSGEDAWIYENLTSLHRIASFESYATFEFTEGAAWSTVGLLCIFLTFPLMSWRRRSASQPS